MTMLLPLRLDADTDMVPAGHFVHSFEPLILALLPTSQDIQRNPSVDEKPLEQIEQVPDVLKISEERSWYPSLQLSV